ncbi:hypothetical protein HYDPIDRAFT_117477 [Hydnomerulius pinastri MD-312]|uniref:Uncharacterized protein n=1 Tax=Hydnomerulius pinastri MD-312 TaxID=994086 RepID=A0A0C9V495_9AGAM|nr:hypothetical protein HYDPIDRAFT_117477 [Hydnomerulius pinastri MD-312]
MRITFTLSIFTLLAANAVRAIPAVETTTSSAPVTTPFDPFNPGPECLPQYLPKCVF